MKIEILGVDKTGILSAGTLNVTRLSRERRTCSLSLFSAASTYLPSAGQDMKVYDNSDSLIFGGSVKQATIDEYESGNSNTTKVLSTLFSDGYDQIAERRVSVTSFTTSYAGDIVEYIRSVTLNSTTYNEGVGAGTIDNGAYYAEFAKEMALVSDIYDELAKASGFKWYIDDSKNLQFTQESTTPDAAHELMSTGSERFHNFNAKQSLNNYRNVQYVIGDRDSDTGVTVNATALSTEQIGIRQAIEGGSSYSSGVYMHIIRDTNIKTTADAQTVADNALKQFGLPDSISFSSYQTDWQPSTKLHVKLPKYGITTDTYYLIEEVSIEAITANTLESHIVATRRDPAAFSSQKTDDDVDFMKNILGLKDKLFDLNTSIGTAAYADWNDYIYPYTVTELDSEEHDTAQGLYNSLAYIDATHFMLAYTRSGSGTLKTFSVDGSYLVTEIDALDYDAAGAKNSLVNMDDTGFVVAYTGDGTDGFIKTFTIDGSYDTITNVDTLEHDISNCAYPVAGKLSATHFVVAYSGASGVGMIKTFSIDGAYDNITEINSLQHDAGATSFNSMVVIDSTHVMVSYLVYAGAAYSSVVKTFTIDGAFAITETDDLTVAAYEEDERAIMQIDATHYALAATNGNTGKANVKTISIDGSYVMTLIDTVEVSNATIWIQSIIMFDNTHLITAGYLTGAGAGWLNMFQLDWTYSATEKYRTTYDTVKGTNASMIKLDDSHVVVAHAGADNDGFIKTYAIETR
jgi:hypothetical protein